MLGKNDIGVLYLSIKDGLARCVAKLVPPDEVEDVVQETYVRVCKFQERNKIAYPKALMFQTAKNIALDYLKRADVNRVSRVEHEDELNSVDLLWENEPYQRANSDHEFKLFCMAVRALPRQCRKAFVLKKVYGYSHLEIAKMLNISDRTVEKHVAIGITRCARFMKNKARHDVKNTESSTQYTKKSL